MFNAKKKEDSEIQQDVTEELMWDPSVTSNQINVTSKDGIVTLRGNVPHYFEKTCAEEAAQRVSGVRAVADEIEVSLLASYEKSDEQIAKAALNAMEWNYAVPKGLKVTVEKGWVTLKGETEWDYQRNAAKDSITQLLGVRGVSNNITIKTKAQKSDVKTRIEDALKRSAEKEGRNIGVSIKGDRVILTGDVHSFSELADASSAAWSAPGVMMVENNLKIN